MSDVKRLETKRLILDGWRMGDAKDLFEYAQNPNVGPKAGWAAHKSVRESRHRIRTVFKPERTWKIMLKTPERMSGIAPGSKSEYGKAIGSIGLTPDVKRPDIKCRELGYSLAEKYWGRGIMTEAAREIIRYGFEELRLDMISITTDPTNIRSQHVINKLGFVREGTLRQAFRFYYGTAHDIICYSMTRSEWELMNRQRENGKK